MCSGKCGVIGMPSFQINESVQGSATTGKSVSASRGYPFILVTLTKLASSSAYCSGGSAAAAAAAAAAAGSGK